MGKERLHSHQELRVNPRLGEEALAILETEAELRGIPYCRSGLKRGLDICLSAPASVFILPAVVRAGKKILDNEGWPPLIQLNLEHPNPDIRSVPIWKIRTMERDAERQEVELAKGKLLMDGIKENDPRVTGVGSELRKSGQDELPQLWNVLAGHISLVGPRGPSKADWVYIRSEGHREPYKTFIALLEKEPIPYGLAGFYAMFRGQLSPEDRFGLEVMYCERASFMADVKILAGSYFHYRSWSK